MPSKLISKIYYWDKRWIWMKKIHLKIWSASQGGEIVFNQHKWVCLGFFCFENSQVWPVVDLSFSPFINENSDVSIA